jgi:hypothetical protein
MANVTMYVEQRPDGKWAVSRPNALKASALRNRKTEAVARAHEIADGGPIHVQGPDGKWTTEQRKTK